MTSRSPLYQKTSRGPWVWSCSDCQRYFLWSQSAIFYSADSWNRFGNQGNSVCIHLSCPLSQAGSGWSCSGYCSTKRHAWFRSQYSRLLLKDLLQQMLRTVSVSNAYSEYRAHSTSCHRIWLRNLPLRIRCFPPYRDWWRKVLLVVRCVQGMDGILLHRWYKRNFHQTNHHAHCIVKIIHCE